MQPMTLRRATKACRELGVETFDARPDGELPERMREEMCELSAVAVELERGADSDEACDWILTRMDYLLERWIAFGLHRQETD